MSLTVVDTANCAVIRLVDNHPERPTEVLERAGLPYTESDLLVVELPLGNQPLLQIFKAPAGDRDQHPLRLSAADRPAQLPAVALHVEDHETAAVPLAKQKFTLFTENDLTE